MFEVVVSNVDWQFLPLGRRDERSHPCEGDAPLTWHKCSWDEHAHYRWTLQKAMPGVGHVAGLSHSLAEYRCGLYRKLCPVRSVAEQPLHPQPQVVLHTQTFPPMTHAVLCLGPGCLLKYSEEMIDTGVMGTWTPEMTPWDLFRTYLHLHLKCTSPSAYQCILP